MPAIVRASPFYIGTNEFFVYSVIAVYKVREFPRCRLFDASQIQDSFEVESMTYGMWWGGEAALLFSTAVDKPVCKTMSNGECRYVVVLAKKAANKKEGKVFFYDRETGKIVEYEDSVPSSSFADNYWPFHKPDGTWLPDYKWK
ncbi:MAG: hypothetical protein IKH55_07465 [Fibrobacter sp.]|nr:hypothetical protein [Fibrobacter sp.]